MKRKNVTRIVRYYYSIPEMVRLLKEERDEAEDLYDGLGSAGWTGAPGGSGPGKPTETLTIRVDHLHVRERLQEVGVRIQVLEGDQAQIRGCLDVISGKYKRIIFLRYLRDYKWVKIAAELGAPESTVRAWHDKAVERMGEALEELPMVEELLGRASRARV